jgi:hypothetical protein
MLMVYVPFLAELAFTMKVEVTEKCEVYSFVVVPWWCKE